MKSNHAGSLSTPLQLKAITDQYYNKIFKMGLFYLKNEEEALDITQEIFLKIAKKISTFRKESKLFTWIYIIAKNTILNYIKKKNIINFLSFETQNTVKELNDQSGQKDPESLMEDDEEDQLLIKKLEKAIFKLSAREKTAFYLYYYDKLKQKEIAKIMHTSISAVESLIFKSKNKIKKSFPSRDK